MIVHLTQESTNHRPLRTQTPLIIIRLAPVELETTVYEMIDFYFSVPNFS